MIGDHFKRMTAKERFQSFFASLSAPDWVANLVALAALIASLYSIKVSRDIAHEQVEREEKAKSMQYTLALRFDVPYTPQLIDTPSIDVPEQPPYLIVSARLFVTNASSLPQAFSSLTFSYDGTRYYPVSAIREPSGRSIDWPLNIAPGTSVAFDIDLPLPVFKEQGSAIAEELKKLELPVRSWRDFEQRVLRKAEWNSKPLIFALPRKVHFWIETLSPSPGFPRKILFEEWVPPNWQSGRD